MAAKGGEGMYIDTLVDRSNYIRAFVDSGCLCYSIISERYTRYVGLYVRVPQGVVST